MGIQSLSASPCNSGSKPRPFQLVRSAFTAALTFPITVDVLTSHPWTCFVLGRRNSQSTCACGRRLGSWRQPAATCLARQMNSFVRARSLPLAVVAYWPASAFPVMRMRPAEDGHCTGSPCHQAWSAGHSFEAPVVMVVMPLRRRACQRLRSIGFTK